MEVEFEQNDPAADGWTMRVTHAGLPVGRILRNARGLYRYYEGARPWDHGRSTFEDTDLERLKGKIRERRAR
jgi:hypothetical protein